MPSAPSSCSVLSLWAALTPFAPVVKLDEDTVRTRANPGAARVGASVAGGGYDSYGSGSDLDLELLRPWKLEPFLRHTLPYYLIIP